MANKKKKKQTDIGMVKPLSIVEEMKNSYISYAMSVIVSRALPDVRDGLKPVQRRILFAMDKMGLSPGGSFRKSATVVGSVLGNYHPHSDTAAYHAMVRMAQDFSMRYPLVKPQGNFGSLDGDPPASMRYCVTGDSMVVTDRCTQRIGSISKEEDVQLKVLSFGKKINEASKLFDSGVWPVVEVTTSKGYSLKGTHNHPVLTLQKSEEEKPVFRWKLLGEVEKEDLAVIDRSNVLWPEEEPELEKEVSSKKGLPTRMSPELSFVVGSLLSRGFTCCGEGCLEVSFKNDKNLSGEFETCFKKVFPSSSLKKTAGRGKNSVTFKITSQDVVTFLKKIGLSRTSPVIPELILDSTRESVREFVRVFFKKGRNFFVSGEKLAKEMQVLLLRFGVVSSLSREEEKVKLSLEEEKNAEIFKRKTRRTQSASEEKPGVNWVPFLSSYIKKKYEDKLEGKKRDWLLKSSFNSYDEIKKHEDKLEEMLSKEDFKIVKEILEGNYYFDRIVSVEERGEERVYSFKVESDCHSFISNGFVSHNTESKLSKMGALMLEDREKDTVNMSENFDGTKKEPDVLPSPVPQLLLNGCLGIAVGVATKIPPHNLEELCDATAHLVDNPKSNTEDLFEFIKGPDFPTGGVIYDRESMIETYSHGNGGIVVRGRAEIVEGRKRARIIISEIPYGLQKTKLLRKIAKLVQKGDLEKIKDIRDESDQDGVRVVLDLKRGAYPKRILNLLYKKTPLQQTFHLNMVALEKGIQPKRMSLAEVLSQFVEHRKEVIRRRTRYDKDKAERRAHILEGFSKAIDDIDAVIETIKASEDRDDAKKNLIKDFDLSEEQAEAILNMRLSSLAKMERKNILDELKEKKELIEKLTAILEDPEKVKDIFKEELEEIKEKFGEGRRTKVFEKKADEISAEDLIPEEECVVALTQKGRIKRVSPSSYRVQHRGGKGVIGAKTKEEDRVEHLVFSNTHDDILFFTDSGKVFKTKVYEVPAAQRTAKGINIMNFLQISSEDRILALLSLSSSEKNKNTYLVMATKEGKVKKTDLKEFEDVRRSGLIAINLKKRDLLCDVAKCKKGESVFLISREGKAIRFDQKEVRSMGRTAMGVKGMDLGKDDEVIGMEVVKDDKNELLIVTKKGYGKRTEMSEYRMQGRAGKGVKAANITKKTGLVAAARVLTGEEENLMIISEKGKVIKTRVKDISKMGRVTQGVIVMKLKKGDKVASISCS